MPRRLRPSVRRSTIPIVVILLLIATSAGPGASRQAHAAPATGAEFTAYAITAELIADRSELAGTMTVDWVNNTDRPQESVYFRLFPNAVYYGEGGTTLLAAATDRQPVEPIDSEDPTVTEIPLPAPVRIDDRVVIELAFRTVIPGPTEASFGIFGGTADGGWTLADWYPIVAGWEEGSGWYLAQQTQFGDPTFGEAATYEVSLTAPDDLRIVSSGRVIAETVQSSSGTTVYEIESGPGRDFTLSAIPESTLSEGVSADQEVSGVTIRATIPDALTVHGLPEAIVEIAGDAFTLY